MGHNPINRLARLRNSVGMDRAELAALCGVDERTLLAWEHRERPIPEPQQAFLCDYFGVSLDYLMGRRGGSHDGAEAAA